MIVAGIAGHVLQSRPGFNPDKLMPDFSKLSHSRGPGRACSAPKAG